MIVVIASGGTQSTPFTTTLRGYVAIHCASAAAASVIVAFAASSGGPGFALLKAPPGTGGSFLVMSGGGDGWVVCVPPTPWGRLEQSPATTSPRSFVVLPC